LHLKKKVDFFFFLLPDLSQKATLLIFDDFCKIGDFPPNFCFSRLIFGILKFWETDKLTKKISPDRKVRVDYVSYP
jgi:hypothetical protein